MREMGKASSEDSFKRQAAYTLLELMVSTVVLLLVTGGAYSVFFVATRGSVEQMTQLSLNKTGVNLRERLRQEFLSADRGSINPPVLVNSRIVSYEPVTGYTGGSSGTAQKGMSVTLEFVTVTGETLNGSDDNGDGRVDEGVVRFKDASGTWIEIATDITGFQLNSVTDGITYSFNVEAVDRDGNVFQQTYSEQIYMRNNVP